MLVVSHIKRRTFIVAAGLGVQACASSPTKPQLSSNESRAWEYCASWVAKLKEPAFASQDFNITDFGAVEGGDASQAIAKAIDTCHKSGGGRVLIPSGRFYSGPIHLQSNVNLHLSDGATISFYTDPKRYLPAVKTRWEGMALMGYSPLIYAYRQTNVAVTGSGVLDGGADREHWWPWKGEKGWQREGFGAQQAARKQLMQDVANGVDIADRHYAEGHYLRPSFIQFYECSQVKVEDITVRSAPFWLIHPVLSQHVIVRNVTLESLGPNSDGCNPESCRYVLIENCAFNTGDDCIAIKSGRNRDGRDIGIPSEDILIRHCSMSAGHGGVVIGSEISGGARNIFVEHCHMDSPDLDRGIRIKTNSVRGGLIEKLYVRHVDIGRVRDAVVVNFHYEEGNAGSHPPTVRDIYLTDITCDNAKNAFILRGFPEIPIGRIVLRDVHFLQAESLGILEFADEISFDGVSINGTLLSR